MDVGDPVQRGQRFGFLILIDFITVKIGIENYILYVNYAKAN